MAKPPFANRDPFSFRPCVEGQPTISKAAGVAFECVEVAAVGRKHKTGAHQKPEFQTLPVFAKENLEWLLF